jgi:hypothetical protein
LNPMLCRRAQWQRHLACLCLALFAMAVQAGHFVMITHDSETQALLPCRIHLKDNRGNAVKTNDAALPFWRDHFVCPGKAELDLPPGSYAFEIERGPEWSAAGGQIVIENQPLTVTNRLNRLANLAAEGWWGGDLHVHRAPGQIELLMLAEDLHIAPVITWWNRNSHWTNRALPKNPLVRFDTNRFYHLMGGEDERDGGALLYFNLAERFDITAGQRFYPHSLVYAREIKKEPGAWIDLEKPFWWDFPAWTAAGIGDSVGIANNHQQRSGMLDSEAWGKPRTGFEGQLGNGHWTLSIYYHLLNSGLRLPPSAGSASGVLTNPVGYNRVYSYLEGDLTWDKWWDALRAGKCFVSNGPLLRCRANGGLPGHVFKIQKGKPLQVTVEVQLTSRDPIEAIEIIRNGESVERIPVERLSDGRVRSSALQFDESGWFLVRAIAKVPHTFRFASTGPFYVEAHPAPRRISKASAQFFLDWTRERMARVKLDDPEQQEEVLRFHREAETFWKERLSNANAP